MHPILSHRHRLGWYLAAWVPVALLLTALVRLTEPAPWRLVPALVLPLCVLYAFQCLPAWYLCRSFPLRESGRLRLLGTLSVAALASASFWLFAGSGWALLLGRAPAFAAAPDLFRRTYPLLFASGVLLFFLAAALSYLLAAATASRELETRALEMKILAREAELRLLRAQIDPHFLFNSLNSVMALIGSRPEEARRMCLLLSDFLRRSLQTASEERISLARELSLMESYLQIEQIRFGDRLQVRMEIEEESRSCLVPPLLLQPLVENAVRHGIARRLEGGEISIRAGSRGGRLSIVVANPIDEEHRPAGGRGIGLANVSARLTALPGGDARLDTYEKNGIFYAGIAMPASTGMSYTRRH